MFDIKFSFTVLSTQCDAPTPSPLPACGCSSCTENVLNAMAGLYSCQGRINWKMTAAGGSLSELDACRFVANEYSTICGPDCHPDLVSDCV